MRKKKKVPVSDKSSCAACHLTISTKNSDKCDIQSALLHPHIYGINYITIVSNFSSSMAVITKLQHFGNSQTNNLICTSIDPKEMDYCIVSFIYIYIYSGFVNVMENEKLEILILRHPMRHFKKNMHKGDGYRCCKSYPRNKTSDLSEYIVTFIQIKIYFVDGLYYATHF